jgi:hypothetical protein
MAIGGTADVAEFFYTELDEIAGPNPGFGATEHIHVTDYNGGLGSGDTRLLLNPRPGSGIQDLTISNSILYAMTGYDTQDPQVYGLNLSTGVVKSGPVTVGFPASHDSDGFAIMPNGNFLVNNGGTSCIYSQYNPTTGAFVAGSTMTVPGNVARCTGVEPGESLFFMTTSRHRETDLFGNVNGFNFFDGDECFHRRHFAVHPVTSITHLDPAISLYDEDSADIGTRFDFQAELLINGT